MHCPRTLLATTALAIALSSTGCMTLLKSKRHRVDAVTIAGGIVLDVAGAYGTAALVAKSSDTSSSGAQGLTLSALVILLDSLMLATL